MQTGEAGFGEFAAEVGVAPFALLDVAGVATEVSETGDEDVAAKVQENPKGVVGGFFTGFGEDFRRRF